MRVTPQLLILRSGRLLAEVRVRARDIGSGYEQRLWLESAGEGSCGGDAGPSEGTEQIVGLEKEVQLLLFKSITRTWTKTG